ncbi:acyl carrier protein [Candidatus Nomurabacteria bacterium]|nr:acyl carrier protein [Candidatus Nomurabacteria bacterium]
MFMEENKIYEETKIEIINFIAETLGKEAETITPETSINDISDDSIQLFELLLAFEKYYDVETAYDDVVNLNTVEDIIQYTIQITSD